MTTKEPIWRLHAGAGPLVATAVHDGHALREEVAAHVGLTEQERLREEDPWTREWTTVAPTRVVGTRSRFEVDLNRAPDKAIYRTPADCWGLPLWASSPAPEVFERSTEEYDEFYRAMEALLGEMADRYGTFVVFDLHSYNHRRGGPGAPIDDPKANPQVNLGTESVPPRFRGVVDAFVGALRAFPFPGGGLDVRENVKFRGGHWPRWIHEKFPNRGVAIAIEFKKFFMDEWTGEPDTAAIAAIGEALQSTVPAVLDALPPFVGNES